MLRRTLPLVCAVFALSAIVLFTTGCGSSSSSHGSNVRMINAMPDEGSLDLLVDTKSSASSVGYGNASSYASFSTGSRHFQIEPTGSTTILIDRTDSVGVGNFSLIALNFSFSPSSILLTDDNTAPTSGNFKLRVVNASPGMLTKDVYVVPDGTDIGSVNPTFPGLAFGSSSGYVTLAAGDYRVFFTDTQKFRFLDSGKLTFSAGEVRTVLGLDNPGGGFEATVLSDSN